MITGVKENSNMKQEDKELLLKDLCGRLLYGVKVTTTNNAVKFGVISGVSIENKISVRTKHAGIVFNCTEVKPYLFPLSSMTKEQKKEYHELIGGMFSTNVLINYEVLTDFFNKNHLDYRGLIPKGLAIDATSLNIY